MTYHVNLLCITDIQQLYAPITYERAPAVHSAQCWVQVLVPGMLVHVCCMLVCCVLKYSLHYSTCTSSTYGVRSTECKDCRLQYHTSLYGVLDQMHCRLRVRICPQPDHESSRYHDAFPCSTIYPGSFYPTGTVRRSLLASGTESRVLSP